MKTMKHRPNYFFRSLIENVLKSNRGFLTVEGICQLVCQSCSYIDYDWLIPEIRFELLAMERDKMISREDIETRAYNVRYIHDEVKTGDKKMNNEWASDQKEIISKPNPNAPGYSPSTDRVGLYLSLEQYRTLIKRVDKFLDTVSSDVKGRDDLSATVKKMIVTHNEYIPE